MVGTRHSAEQFSTMLAGAATALPPSQQQTKPTSAGKTEANIPNFENGCDGGRVRRYVFGDVALWPLLGCIQVPSCSPWPDACSIPDSIELYAYPCLPPYTSPSLHHPFQAATFGGDDSGKECIVVFRCLITTPRTAATDHCVTDDCFHFRAEIGRSPQHDV